MRSTRRAAPRDHPRVCGEHADVETENGRLWGSPPRMRGTLLLGILSEQLLRITPAYAGNTNLIRAFDLMDTDHPRVCGEHYS